MSYNGHIWLEKKLQTKPLSINIDRKGGNFVVFAFSKYQTCNTRLELKHESTKNSIPNCALVFHLVLALLIVVVDRIELKVKYHGRY
jgi:hypothetical protein